LVLTDKEIREIERRLNDATPGPYMVGKTGGSVVTDNPIDGCLGGSDAISYYGGYLIAESITPKNSRFLAGSWQDIKNLLETIRTERRENND